MTQTKKSIIKNIAMDVLMATALIGGFDLLCASYTITRDLILGFKSEPNVVEQTNWQYPIYSKVYAMNGHAPFYVDEPPFGSLDFVVRKEHSDSRQDSPITGRTDDYEKPNIKDFRVFDAYYSRWKKEHENK